MKIPQKYKMKIILDIQKIETDGKYSVENIENAVRKACSSINIQFVDGFYICDEYESVMAILSSISNRDWLFKYIKEWNLYDSTGSVEDLLA